MDIFYDDSTRTLTDSASEKSFVLHDDFLVSHDENGISIVDGDGIADYVNNETFSFFEIYNELKIVADRITGNTKTPNNEIKRFQTIIYSFYLLFFNPYGLKGKFVKPRKHIHVAAEHFLHVLKALSDFDPKMALSLVSTTSEFGCDTLHYFDVLQQKSARDKFLREKGSKQDEEFEPFFLVAYSSCPNDYKGGPDGPISEGYKKYKKECKGKCKSYAIFRRRYLKWKSLHKAEESQRKIREKYDLPEFDSDGGFIVYEDPDKSDYDLSLGSEK